MLVAHTGVSFSIIIFVFDLKVLCLDSDFHFHKLIPVAFVVVHVVYIAVTDVIRAYNAYEYVVGKAKI